jgi:hypothetical protein
MMSSKANASESESGEDTTTDDRLRKSLEKLKKSTTSLQDQDTEGGLSSEGKPLSDMAKKKMMAKSKKATMKKRYSESDMSSPEEMGSKEDMSSDMSEDESDEKSPMKPPMMAKGKKKPPMKKSIQERVEEEDDNLAKGMRVNDALSEFVSATSDTIRDYQADVVSRTRALRKSLVEIGAAQTEDGQVLRKGMTLLAESQVALSEQLGELRGMMCKILKQPAARPTSILNKSQLPEEEREQIDESERQRTPYEETELVKSWLEEGVARGKVNARYMAGYENHQRFDLLPEPLQREIRKSIEGGWKPKGMV